MLIIFYDTKNIRDLKIIEIFLNENTYSYHYNIIVKIKVNLKINFNKYSKMFINMHFYK